MKTTRFFIVLSLLSCLLCFTTGCQIKGFQADEVHLVFSMPGVTDEIHAVGIKKDTASNGEVTRRADTLTHSLSILGFTRTATYKGAVLETAPEKK